MNPIAYNFITDICTEKRKILLHIYNLTKTYRELKDLSEKRDFSYTGWSGFL